MKITITKILKANTPFSGVSKTSGKPYTIYGYSVSGTINGTACELFTVKCMDEETANKIQAGGEFEAEESDYKGDISYMIRGNRPSGGKSYGGGKYTPRVYISGRQFADLCRWCGKLSREIFPENPVDAFDKILGTASVLLDMSKYSSVKQEEKKPEPIKIVAATEPMKIAPGEDPHAIPEGEEVPF